METAKEQRLGSSSQLEPFSSLSSSYAPWYDVPRRSIVSVEHPFMIGNVEKGVKSLGGAVKMQELIQDSENSSARLYLHPGDRMFKPLQSTNVTTHNVLLKITVPKRVRVRRRRGSQGPLHRGRDNAGTSDSGIKQTNQESATRDTQSLIGNMGDNPTKYQVQIVGSVGRTHRFRGMPDFVVSTAKMPFMQKMHEQILPFDYEKMRRFTLDMSKGVKPNAEIIPPPQMSHLTLPFNYSYRQNPYVMQVIDQRGNVSTKNAHGPRKVLTLPVPFDIPEVPSAPTANLDPLETLELPLQNLVASVRSLLEERPIFTRRALINSLPDSAWDKIGSNSAKYMWQYCCYSFSSGPWRDAMVRFGVDPRKDPECRAYQTMMFMLESETKDNRAKQSRSKRDGNKSHQGSNKESHLFDGNTVSKDGKVWQVCDISDPLLKDLLATTNIRNECHNESDGWYHNGTWAKAKIIMKTKIQAILNDIPQQETSYAKVVRELPENVKPNEKANAKLGKDASQYEVQLASQVRSACYVDRVSALEITASQDGGHDDTDGDEQDDGASDDGMIDPGLADAAMDINGSEEDTEQIEEMVDDMEIDMSTDDEVTTP